MYTIPIADNVDQIRREKEWSEIEELITVYQKQFTDEAQKTLSKRAMNELLNRFSPLFKKYLQLLTTGQIDFSDLESKMFVMLFIDDPILQRALRRPNISPASRAEIYHKFNFVKENYGSIEHEEILTDLHVIFMTIAKRYKQIGKSFCGYIYNTYRHEVARHIKRHIKNPINIKYKNVEYEDSINSSDFVVENNYEERYYEDATGMPDISWVQGKSCSEIFSKLSPIDRKILIKYYLEMCNDRQISECFSIHINTINNNRRHAVNIIADVLNINPEDIKRSRRSGKKAILPQI